MKKNVKTIMGGFLSVALLAGFISCSNGTSDETNQAAQGLNLSGASSASGTAIAAEDIFSGEKITFKVTDASTTAADTVFVIKYDRSAKGAAEKITLNDVNVEVTVNGEAVSIGNKIDFELDPYSSFNPSYNYNSPESANDQHEYKAKPVINKKLAKDDTVTIEVKSAKVSGEGTGTVDLGKITVAVVDINKAVNYYKEVAVSGEKAEKYIPLITKKNGKGLNEVETPAPAVNTNENNNTNTNTNTDNTNTNTNTDNNNTNTNNNNATPAATTYSGNLITFTAKEASADATNTVLLIKYDRSSAGANEKITLNNVNLEVKIDNNPITMPTSLEFNLDENGSKFDANATGTDNLKEYKIKLPLGVQLATNNVVTVQLKSSNLSENSAQNVNLASIAVALIDTAESVGWYKELSDNEYQPLISLN